MDKDKRKLYTQKTNVIENMTKTNQAKFFNSRLRHYFGSWREGHRRRKRGSQSMITGIYKLLTQKTFTHIKNFSRATDTEEKKEKTSNRLVRIWSKFRLKQCLAQWRQQEF